MVGIRVSSTAILMWAQAAGTRAWARRGMCSEVGSSDGRAKKKEQLPSVESKLRQLYLRVHPDLFSSYPNAKKANEKSFQRLTEFLSTVKKASTPTMQTSTQAFPMEFYMRPVADRSTVQSEEDLERVDITLRNSPSIADKHKQLGLLFQACGLGGEFAVDAESAGFSRHSLQGFLYDVAAEAAQRKIAKSRETRDIVARQHMLHLHHNVRVTLSACKGSADKLSMLDKMLNYDVLDVLAKLGRPSVHCIIGHSNGVDARGGIILDKNEDIDKWCRHIAALHLHDMVRGEASIASVREAEARAAKHMGLQYVHADGAIEHRSEYSRLLSDVVGRAPRVEEAKGAFRRASGAVLLVKEEVPAGSGCDIEEQRGTILAALSCDPESLVGFVLDHGHRVARMRDAFMKRQRLLSDSLVEAKRALGVSDLDVDRSVVSDHEAIECFQRLATSAGTLSPPTGIAPLVQGVSLCVGDEYLLREDGTIVIPHDFQVSG